MTHAEGKRPKRGEKKRQQLRNFSRRAMEKRREEKKKKRKRNWRGKKKRLHEGEEEGKECQKWGRIGGKEEGGVRRADVRYGPE